MPHPEPPRRKAGWNSLVLLPYGNLFVTFVWYCGVKRGARGRVVVLGVAGERCTTSGSHHVALHGRQFPGRSRRPARGVARSAGHLAGPGPAPVSAGGAARAAEAPTPLAPLAGDTTPTEATPLAIPEFRWTAVEATKYRLQISRDSFARTLPVNITTANAAHAGRRGAVRRWRVNKSASSAVPVSDWSATSYFTKQWKDGTNVPALLFPKAMRRWPSSTPRASRGPRCSARRCGSRSLPPTPATPPPRPTRR